MIHITAYRPANGNMPKDWTDVNIKVQSKDDLEQKREYWRKYHKATWVDITYKQTK